jgi:hypothetical protein
MMGLMFLGPLLVVVAFLTAVFLVGVMLAGGTDALRRLANGLRLESGFPSAEARDKAPAGGGDTAAWPTSKRLCPACSEPFEPGWRVCPHCGQPLV